MKFLEYPMPLLTLEAATWVDIMSPVLQVCLPKAGICRSFPCDMVLAPLKFQGLGIPHPFGSQVSKHIETLLRHSTNKTKTGAYLEAALQEHQLETGTSFGVFQQDYCNTAVLASDTWIKRVWKELENMDIYVAFDSPALPLRCVGDALLVEVFMDLEVNQDDLKWLNWCRMFLQACTVSDIVTADGRCIRQSAWCGERDEIHRSPYQWPRTVRPNRNHWRLWQDTLTRALLQSDDPSHHLRQPLGPWFDSIDDWNWLVSPTHGVFHRHGHAWRHYGHRLGSYSSSRRFHMRPASHRTSGIKTPMAALDVAEALSPSVPFWTKPLPDDVCRVTAQPLHGLEEIVILGVGLEHQSPRPVPQPSLFTAWEAASAEVDEYFGWTPEELEIVGDEGRLVEALLSGHLCVISDGSYKRDLGTAAVQLLPRKGEKDRIIVRCQTPGLPQDQSAYRSELIGLLAGIMVIDWLLHQWAPTLQSKPRVRIACDGFSTLLNTFSDNRVTPQQAQFDLVSSLREALARSKASWEPSHVYGHLDHATPFSSLSWWSKRNVEVDNWAVAYRHQLEASNQLIAPNARFFTELAALYIGGVKQSRLDPDYIQELFALPALRKRWREKLTVTPGPRTVRPNRNHWRLWQDTLTRALLQSDDPSHQLRQPLGPWFDPIDDWNWLVSPTHGVFHRHGHAWRHYGHRSGSYSSSWRFHMRPASHRTAGIKRPIAALDVAEAPSPSVPFWTKPLPDDVCRVTTQPLHGVEEFVISGVGLEHQSPRPVLHPSLFTAWEAASAEVDEYFGWTPNELEIVGDEGRLVEALLSGHLCVISDGSYKRALGTASVQLLPRKGEKDRIIVRCQTPGLPQDQSVYRSELIGLLAGIMVVDWLLQQWAPMLHSKPRVRIACDGFSALLNTFSDNRVSPHQAQFDLVSSLHKALARSKASWEPSHVYGHLDHATPFSSLSWWSKRNVEVDNWAVAYRHQLEASNQLIAPNARFFTELAALYIGGVKQSRLDPDYIQELFALPALRKRWREKLTVTPGPRTVRPNRNHWRLWQDTLTRALLQSDDPSHQLRQPLGPWFDPIDDWNWLVSPTHGVFHRHGHAWRHYGHRSGSYSSSWRFHMRPASHRTAGIKRPIAALDVAEAPSPSVPFWTKPLPDDVCRVTTQPLHGVEEFVISGVGLEHQSPRPVLHPSLFTAWEAASAEVDEYFGWTPNELEIVGDEGRLVEALLSGHLCVISDGSYKRALGTASVQLLPRKGEKDRIIVRCQTPGLPQDQSVYRSELIGLLAGIMVVDWLLQQWAPMLHSKPRVRIACDGFSALLNTFSDNRVSPHQAQFDLVSSLHKALARSKASWEPSHVYGHLDHATPFSSLSWWSKRNVEVDNWAVAYRHQLEASNQLIAPNARFFTELAALYIGGVKQSRLDPDYIQELFALPALRKRWREKLTVTPGPRTVRPNRNHWRLWQDTLTRALLQSDDPSHQLRQPLGPWFDPIDDWNWLVSPTHGVFHRHGHAWRHYGHRSGSYSSSWRFHMRPASHRTAGIKRPIAALDVAEAPSPSVPFWTKPLPDDVCRVTTQPLHGVEEFVISGVGLEHQSPRPVLHPSLFTAWEAASAEVDEYFGWTPNELEIVGDEGRLVEALLSGHLCVISDGSYKRALGTASVQLLPRKGEKDRIIVRCQTPGLPQDQSVYRSELIGLLAGIMVVDWLLQQWAPMLHSKPRVRIACDGFSALLNTFSDNRVSPHQAQFDLVSSLHKALARSKASWEPSHVYGHLDHATPFSSLSWWSKRNVEVDNWAVAYRHQLEASNQLIAPNARFFTELAALYIGGVKQSRLDPDYIQELVALPALRKRWREKLTVTPGIPRSLS
ncbi:unnamed protein product [Cylindrotheca closterium]|uniref:Uncharacterized protein n=1 Tax=Cylindrotheca closterium TaxID=2856 RepID=A0AAD2GAD7_9STRA|nr:unnamed protein product [Cylindrotheca closterium]